MQIYYKEFHTKHDKHAMTMICLSFYMHKNIDVMYNLLPRRVSGPANIIYAQQSEMPTNLSLWEQDTQKAVTVAKIGYGHGMAEKKRGK